MVIEAIQKGMHKLAQEQCTLHAINGMIVYAYK